MVISDIKYNETPIAEILEGVFEGLSSDSAYQNISTNFCGGFHYLKKNSDYHMLEIHKSDKANCLKGGILENSEEKYETGVLKGCGLIGDNISDKWQEAQKLDKGICYIDAEGRICKSDGTPTGKMVSKVSGFIAVAGGGAGGRTGNAYAGRNHSAGSGGAGATAYGIIQTYGFEGDIKLWIKVGSGGATSDSLGGTGKNGEATIFKLSADNPEPDWTNALLKLNGGTAGQGAYIETGWKWKYMGGKKGTGGKVDAITDKDTYIHVAGSSTGNDGIDGNGDCIESGSLSTDGIDNYKFGPTDNSKITFKALSKRYDFRNPGGCSLIGLGGYAKDTGSYTPNTLHYGVITRTDPTLGGGGAGGIRMYAGWYGNNNSAEIGTAGGDGAVFFFS